MSKPKAAFPYKHNYTYPIKKDYIQELIEFIYYPGPYPSMTQNKVIYVKLKKALSHVAEVYYRQHLIDTSKE